MNVKMVTMEDVLTIVPTHVEDISALVDLAMSSRERRRGLGVEIAVRVGVGIWLWTLGLMLAGPVKVHVKLQFYVNVANNIIHVASSDFC